MKNSPILALLLSLMLLLHQPVSALNWQGTGDFDQGTLEAIWTYIHANLANAENTSTQQQFTNALSILLNDRWSPAWNVVMVRFIQAPTYNDVILIGYAFRNHWMWFNGHIDPSIPTVMYSFVIWKDYNCKDWKTLDQPTSFSAGQQAVITNLFTSITKEQIINDPWKLAKSMVDSVQASSEFVVANDRAYSIVFSQDFFTSTMYSRICVVGQNYYNSKSEYYSPIISDEGLHYGQFILFRTR